MSDLNKLKELAKALPAYTETIEALLERLEAAEARVEALEGEVEVLQSDLSDTTDAMHLWAERATTAESELARRDKEAGEPVAYFVRRENEPFNTGTKIDAKDKASFPWPNCVYQPLYSAAQPAALPPEMDSLKEPAGDRWSFAMGYNQAIADAKALGAQPRRVKLPETFSVNTDAFGIIEGLHKSQVIETLKSYGIEVEE